MAVALDVERDVAAGVDVENLRFERDPKAEGDLVAKARGARRAGELAAGKTLRAAAELEASGEVQAGRAESVLGEEPRRSGHRSLAHVRALVPGGERDPLVDSKREAAELPAGRPDQRELAVEPQIAERLRGQGRVAEDALLALAGGVPLLEEQ